MARNTTRSPAVNSEWFHPKTKEEELILLHNDDPSFSRTTDYVSDLILAALAKFEWTLGEFTILRNRLLTQVPLAARRYLQKKENGTNFKFSTYFAWYIAGEINARQRLKRRNRE